MNKIIPNSTQNPVDTRGSKALKAEASTAESHNTQQAAPAGSQDTVKISSQAVDMSQLETRIGQLPDTDVARVVDLHSRITSGDYQINSESIATKMLDMETFLDS